MIHSKLNRMVYGSLCNLEGNLERVNNCAKLARI